MSGQDDRIDSECQSAGADGSEILKSNVCSNFWKPTFLWPNANDIRIIEDNGLSTFVGEQSSAQWWKRTPGVNHSFGYISYKIVGKFQGLTLSYERFPYDTQELTIILRAPNMYPSSTLRFLGAVGMAGRESDELVEPADWKVEGVAVNATPYKWSIPPNLQHNPDSPLFSWLAGLPGFSFDDNWATYSQLVFTVQISRKSQYMLWNFVILISLLVWLSFLTFFFAPDAIDVRPSVALTVILAINVYQVSIL